MDISPVTKNIVPLLKHNTSSILSGLGVAGSVASMVLAVKATPAAQNKLDVAFFNKNDNDEPGLVPLTRREVVKLVWKDYIPAASLQVVTIACIVGAQSINLRKQTALISIATVSETAFREYQDRMAVEVPTKDRKVRDDIAREKVDANPVSGREVLVIAGGGDQLFYEPQTDRYFMSTMQKVQKAVIDINFHIINDNYAPLNAFFSLLGLKSIAQGEDLGWTTEVPLEVNYSAQVTDDDRTAMVIEYRRLPIVNFYKGFQ